MLRLLFQEQLSVNAISGRLDVSQYNISKHLRVLREAGLLQTEKHGKKRLYSVTPRFKANVPAQSDVLDLGCCLFRLDKLRL